MRMSQRQRASHEHRSMSLLVRILRHDERGIAMITAISVAMVASLLGFTATRVASVSITRSGDFRNDVAAVHAAESGINVALGEMAKSTGNTWCGVSASAATKLPGAGVGAPVQQQYEVTVTDSNPANGACTTTDPIRVITSTGWSPDNTTAGALSRTMEAEVNLVAVSANVPAGFTFSDAIFANSSTSDLGLSNSVAILRDGGANNADVYSNDDIILSNSTAPQGDVIGQKTVRISNSVHVYGDVYAVGNITMSNSAVVDGNVVSATGSITMSNSARINGNAQAAGSITTNNSATIAGTRLANSPSSSPAVRSIPTFTWDANDASWPQPVITHTSCANFDTWLNTGTNRSNFAGTHRITSNCAWGISNSTTITLTGDAAIVTDGYITCSNSAQFRSTTGTRKLWLISLQTTSSGSGVTFSNSCATPNLETFIFARRHASKSNSVSLTGQIYAETLSLSNSFSLQFRAMTVPGFTMPGAGASVVTAYNTQVLYIREVSV